MMINFRILLGLTLFLWTAPPNLIFAQYFGGDGNGYITGLYSSYGIYPCNPFFGGNGDGYDTARVNTTDCAMYFGGDGDGYDTELRPNPDNCALFFGSSGDGYDAEKIPSICLMYFGGNSDGYQQVKTPNTICPNFFGGINDGYYGKRISTDNYCEITKTRLLSTPCGVRDNGVYCNRLTSVQVGEPSGLVWAADGIQNTLWFEFYPPSSGTFSIETVTSDFDTELAIYQADALTNCPSCQLASAESGGTGTNAKITLSCLDPNQKYYLQLDGKSGAVGNTSIRITDICPAPTYSGTNECNNTPATTPGVYNFCISPNTAGITDPNIGSLGTIATSGTSVCGQSLDINLEHSTYLPIQLNSSEVNIDVTLNQSLCKKGFSIMVFQSATGNCPNPNEWGDVNNPMVGCFQGNGLGNVFAGTGLTPNTTYYILVDGFQADGGILQLNITSAVVVPLTWLNFDGERKNNAHYLYWKTGSELNVSHFEIERSSDGLQFEKIGQTPAIGNSTHEQAYSFIDQSPMLGHNYYRIKQVDTDQNFTHSRIIVLDNNSSFAESFSIYPNPALDEVFVRCNVPLAETTLYIELYDVLGRKLLSELVQNPSLNTHRLLVGHLVAGAYFIKISTPKRQNIYHHKLIKQSN